MQKIIHAFFVQFVSKNLIVSLCFCVFVSKNLYALKCLIWFKLNAKNNPCLLRAIVSENLTFLSVFKVFKAKTYMPLNSSYGLN